MGERSKESLVSVDAKNRALRTFLQNIGFDILAAIAVVLYTAFNAANGWGDLEWALIGFTLVKTTVVTGLSYVMRKALDDSSIPTPLPPAMSGEAPKV